MEPAAPNTMFESIGAGGRVRCQFRICSFDSKDCALSPAALGGSPVKLFLRNDDIKAVTARAEAAGAMILRKAKDEFSGERTAMVSDPFGYVWFLSAPIEEVSPAEMQER
ncbi:MAG: VOC family protein [Rhodospirillales bacterium]|nr:VOC family protein [Rhodospirillales bacterium]